MGCGGRHHAQAPLFLGENAVIRCRVGLVSRRASGQVWRIDNFGLRKVQPVASLYTDYEAVILPILYVDMKMWRKDNTDTGSYCLLALEIRK
jgi:hypothetical protein